MTLRLPRECHAGLHGPDVLAYSDLYRRAGIRLRPRTRGFGVHMVHNTMEYQHRHGLPVDGVVGQHTFDAMRPHLNNYERWLVGRADRIYAPLNPRHLIVGAALALYAQRPFPYEEVRPIPSTLVLVEDEGSDCSGTSIDCYRYAHGRFQTVPDPSGNHFDRYGSTAVYMTREGRRVYVAQPGDLAFYYPTYSHVGVYLGNGRVFSHGKPGDPVIIPLSWSTMVRSYL